MSHSGKKATDISESGVDNKPDSLTCDANKPDFRELDLGSPVTPLRTRPSGLTTTTTTTSSSSSSSSGSVSAQTRPNPVVKRPVSSPKSHSGELSGSAATSPKTPTRNFKPGHNRSDTGSTHPLIYSGHHQSSVNSPPVNVLPPTGNIIPSGRISKTGMGLTSNKSTRTETLGSGSGHYGHGSIMRGGSSSLNVGGVAPSSRKSTVGGGASVFQENAQASKGKSGGDAEEVKRLGNELYRKGCFGEALSMYDRAIALVPGNAPYRANRAAALTCLGRIVEAVKECEEAVRLDPQYWRAHHRLATLLIRLGQVENARSHLFFPGQQPDPAELQKLQAVEKHISRCTDARKASDWKSALREADAAIAAGAEFSPQLFMCRAEAHLKLHKLEDAESSLSNVPKLELSKISSCSQTRFFGMLAEAYPLFVRAQIDMALGRFENAVTAAEKAGYIDPRNVEAAVLLKNVRLVARARARGNDLFKSERFTEACSVYGEGLRVDPSNSVLYGNRAACWFKLGLWERCIEDCNQALSIQPNYSKALRRRAASNCNLERWADAATDYEVLRREFPDDNEVAESLFHAQVALKKSRGEDVSNMKFGGEVEEVSGLEQFRAAVSVPGISIIHFKSESNPQCKQLSPFVDTLCGRYPSINFLKVDIDESPAVASAENVRIVPTFKIYKNGSRVKEIVCPSRDMLENSVRHYSL